jgi:hypothetical protein
VAHLMWAGYVQDVGQGLWTRLSEATAAATTTNLPGGTWEEVASAMAGDAQACWAELCDAGSGLAEPLKYD